MNSFLKVNGNLGYEVNSPLKNFVNVNVILTSKTDEHPPLKPIPKDKTLFVVDVSVDWVAVRRWQTKPVDT